MTQEFTTSAPQPKIIEPGTKMWVYVPARRALVRVEVCDTSTWYAYVFDGKGATKTVSTNQLISDVLAGMLIEEKQAVVYASLEAL